MAETQTKVAALSRWTELCDQFSDQWNSGLMPRIEDVLKNVSKAERPDVFRKLLGIELAGRSQRGESCDVAAYRNRFPEFAAEVDSEFASGEFEVSTGATVASTVDIRSAGRMSNRERMPGELIGRYLLKERVGEGGFGEVWTAHDQELDRVVAVKFARTGTRVSASFKRKFRDEARKAAKLTHRGIVPVYDVQDDDGGFIVAEYIDGPTLKQRIADGPVDVDTAVELATKIADALHFAHMQDLVHRDVKPANILLRPNGDPVLTDFGLAISEIELQDESSSVVGTRSYMSPEQAAGQVNLTDARTDVYSLGVILYELLTGRPPFLTRSLKEYIEHVGSRNPRPLRTIDDTIDPELERICLRCLERSTSDRYTTCREIGEALRAFQSRRAGAKSKRWWAIGGSLAALCALAAYLGFVNTGHREEANGGGGENTTPNAEIVPPASISERDAEGWLPLLDAAPKTLAWERGPGREKPQIDTDQRRYAVRSNVTDWVATTKVIEARPYEVRAALQIDKWIGMGGITFAFQRDHRKALGNEYHGLIVDYYRRNPQKPPMLRLRHLELERVAFDHLRVTSMKMIAEKSIPVPKTEHAELKIAVTKAGIVVYWTESEQTVEWKPQDLFHEAEWLPNGRTEVGMTGQGREVVFRDLSIRHTLTRKTK